MITINDDKELVGCLIDSNIKRKDLAIRLDRPYSTVSSWLNGYSPLPIDYRIKIMEIINESNCKACQ